jgi:EAL domain-containing protein (putative c-di-GMP-specific phosphodiesterase class I)
LRHADIAMYRAKSLGKARYVVFEPLLDKRAMDVLQLETDLRQSLQNRTFQLCYQPIVCLQTGRVVSFEALLRWNHPRRGVLRPAEFLPVAEEAGLTIPLGHWVIREACQRLQEWRQLRPELRRLSVNVNLSGREFMQPQLVDMLHGILKDTELPGDLLTVELTESMIMENDEIAAQKLQYLRELGIRLAIDDFGRGYSSLVRLQEFPISILKVDGAFVSRISAGKSQIFDAIMALATELKLDVTAEGVEKVDQFHYLRKSGAAMGQGLFFSDVLTSDHVERLLRGQDPVPWAGCLEGLATSGRATGIAAG